MPRRLRFCAVAAVVVLVVPQLFAQAVSTPTNRSSSGTPPASRGFSAEQINAVYPEVQALYVDLHRNPELGFQEKQTSAKLAERLRALGYEVTTGIGGTGVVAILKNGAGPTVMLRADMDALPVQEKTGLPFASTVTAKTALGATVPVMHACGHDTHVSSLVGTAKLMAQNRQRWHGTLMLLGQPSEENVLGASAMIKDGLFTRFPKPDIALALHDTNMLPTGQVGTRAGYYMSASDTVYITIYGRGSHGARPQMSVDPIVIGSRIVMTLQTLVSRENDPLEMAIVTVGSFHGGNAPNIISDEAKLEVTVRSFNPQVRKKLLSGIERIVKAEAMAAAAPREPQIRFDAPVDALYNNPELTNRMVGVLRQKLGKENVVDLPPVTASEDFAQFSTGGFPLVMFHFGAANKEKWEASKKTGEALPGPHSPLWAPEQESLKVAMNAETTMLLELMGTK